MKKIKNSLLVLVGLATTMMLSSCGSDVVKPNGEYKISWPTSGTMTIPGPDGWHAEGKVWLGEQGVLNKARINAYDIKESYSSSWYFKAKLDVVSKDPGTDNWDTYWWMTDRNGNNIFPYEGYSKKDGSKIRVCGYTYSKS